MSASSASVFGGTQQKNIQIAGRVVDNWDGTYSVYFHLPYPGVYEGMVTFDHTACTGYRLKNEASGNFLGSKALKFKIHHHVEPPPTASPVKIIENSVNPEVLSFLSNTGHYLNVRWLASPVSCSIPSTPPPPKNVGFAGDSTTGQIAKCFYGGNAEVNPQSPLDHILDPTNACMDNRFSRLKSIPQSSPFDSAILSVQASVLSSTFGQTCGLGSGYASFTSIQDYCHLPIMAKGTNWAKKSEEVVENFVKGANRNADFSPTTMVIGESAHIQASYSYEEFVEKLGKVRDLVNSGGAGLDNGNVLVWRENWPISDYCIKECDYTSKAPEENVEAMEKGGVGSKLSGAQAYLHRSLTMDLVHFGTGGKARWVESYWLGKAYYKRAPREEMKCWFEACDDVRRFDGNYYDIRHMPNDVVENTVVEILKMWVT
ncbi:hypothetical protein TrCOL_g12440 [Triparma columacea]|uniref:Uncharacterized protein n=1 Tax=Triparma columacea TaxID=722753 RepID=A0A9W7GCF8_9STRA|nr:hypothetical protein TrCOL_g12440 [Triparma columacea]